MALDVFVESDRNRAIRGTDLELSIQYLDGNGDPINAEAPPVIHIVDSDGATVFGPSYDNVYLDPDQDGLYKFSLSIPNDADLGIWTDYWTATVDGSVIESELKFLVAEPIVTTSGQIRIGDDVNMDFSDEEIMGINILLKMLKARLRSSGFKPVRDEFGAMVRDGYGELILEPCNVFSDEILVTLLCSALSEFNGVPFFTAYSFADNLIQALFSHFIVEGAYIQALASQALLEKGRDFTISDSGISYQPPQLGDFLNSQFSTWLTSYRERLKFVKNSIRPGPRGVATFSSMGSNSPSISRLRHLRSRKII